MAMAPAISNLRLLLLLVLAATFAAASKWGGAEDLAARGEALLRVSADPDPAELRAYAEARALMRGAKAATLATFLAEDVSGTGEPGPAPRELAGQPYTMAHDIADINGTGLPAVMFAWNAVDFINLKHDKRASLTVAARRCPEMEVAPGLADDALCPRLTILGEMEPPADKALAEARARARPNIT
eukprot:tig00020904_g15214.t1